MNLYDFPLANTVGTINSLVLDERIPEELISKMKEIMSRAYQKGSRIMT